MRVRSRGKTERPTLRRPFLWYRSTRYAPATASADPLVREAFERGQAARESDGALPPEFSSWSSEQQHAFRAGLFAHREQRDLRAPLPWPIQAVALLLRSAVQFRAVAIKERRGQVRASALALPLYGALMMAEQRLEKREAQRLRLTPETAPRISLDMSFTAAQIAFSSAARLRGFTIVEPTPPVALAQHIVAEIDRRRSRRAALADGEGLEPTTISHSSS